MRTIKLKVKAMVALALLTTFGGCKQPSDAPVRGWLVINQSGHSIDIDGLSVAQLHSATGFVLKDGSYTLTLTQDIVYKSYGVVVKL